MDKILVSACLLGQRCRYDGKDNEESYFEVLNRYFDLVPFCPEVAGGLPTPRPRSEIKGSQVITENGKTVTREFEAGAAKALEICRFLNIDKAILKENSPSCGVHQIHDGKFHNKLIHGQGRTAALLQSHDIRVMNEEEGKAFLDAYLAHLESKPAYQKKEETPVPSQNQKLRDWRRHKDQIRASKDHHVKDKGFRKGPRKPFKKDR
ncbi:MAG: DUF523 domain-containing protein [Bacilli bacterium]|nr:DUF523 domain-containing protein [Bacilli bacterium]